MEESCRKCASKARQRPLFNFGNWEETSHARNSFENQAFWMRITKAPSKKSLDFLLPPIRSIIHNNFEANQTVDFSTTPAGKCKRKYFGIYCYQNWNKQYQVCYIIRSHTFFNLLLLTSIINIFITRQFYVLSEGLF